MVVTVWGARGSFPVPGPDTLRYGGNTSCVSVELGGRTLVLDAGTGIRSLGRTMVGGHNECYVLLTHAHSDHTQGFPFFGPLYEPGRAVHALDVRLSGEEWTLLNLFDAVTFPLRPAEMPANLLRVEGDALAFLRERGFNIRSMAVNHPGGAHGYRIEHEGKALVYIPDNELNPPSAATASFEHTVAFCEAADYLIHDAQYLPSDMPMKWGWGHSTLDDVCRLSIAARVKHLVLFHHDPGRTDAMLDGLENQAKTLLAEHNIQCTGAYEGLSFELSCAAKTPSARLAERLP